MDSDQEDAVAAGFTKQGGEALNLDGGNDFNDSEDVDDADDDDQPGVKKASGSKGKEVKGKELENQPYDLAVDVNDSEEIESEEEDDEVNVNDVQRAAPA